jgi:hypothetical protein
LRHSRDTFVIRYRYSFDLGAMGRAHWTWYFITPAGFCSKCNTTLKSPCTTNNVTHLGNKHGIMKDSPETIAKIDAAKEEEASE